MRYDVTKDKVVSCRITSEQYYLMKKHNVSLKDIVNLYFMNKGYDNKEFKKLELDYLEDRRAKLDEDYKLDSLALEMEIEKVKEELWGIHDEEKSLC